MRLHADRVMLARLGQALSRAGRTAPRVATGSTADTVLAMWRRIIVVGGVCVVILGGTVAVVKALDTARHQRAFRSMEWRQPVAFCKSSPREQMVDDLVQNHLPHGLSRRKVRHLLGAPDQMDAGYWYYNVGDARSFAGPEYFVELEVRFNGSGLSGATVYSFQLRPSWNGPAPSADAVVHGFRFALGGRPVTRPVDVRPVAMQFD